MSGESSSFASRNPDIVFVVEIKNNNWYGI